MAGALNTGDQGDQGDRGDSGDSGDAPAKRKKWIFMSSHRIPLVALVPLVPRMVSDGCRRVTQSQGHTVTQSSLLYGQLP